MLQFFYNTYRMLHELNLLSITVRLGFAVLLGGIIGLERGLKRRPAGMRTYMLVCLGSTLVMITNEYMSTVFAVGDPARMGAQVISGIGFLGAGTIIITRDRQVRGLTTAAGLWASACMGLAIGVGFYSGAVIGTVFIIFITTVMHRLDTELVRKSRSIDVYLEVLDSSNVYRFLDYIRESGMKITHMDIVKPKYDRDKKSQTAMYISLLLPTRKVHFELLSEFNNIEYVCFAEEV